MAKVLSFAVLVFLICFGGSAWAKPKIAILGLEVVPGPTGVVDPETTQVARDITKELRQRVQSSASPYVMAPNSSKELTDEKLLMSCDNEAVSCMVVIGAGLAADVLLYGHVERKGEVYRVSLRLLDIKAKTFQAGGDELPEGGSIAGVSRRIYSKLIGDLPSPTGTLIINAKRQAGGEIAHGAVVVDEERRGDLAGGKLTVTGIAEGRHTVAIEAGGYRRFEDTVTVRGGEQVSVDALLVEKVTSPPPERSTLLWKVSLGAGAAVAAAGAAYAYHSYQRMLAHSGKFDPALNKNTGMPYTDNVFAPDAGDCGRTPDEIAIAKHSVVASQTNFDRACTWKKRIYASFVVGGVGLAGAVVSLILLSRETESAEKSPAVTRSKKPEVALVPMWMADGGGASFSVRW